MTKLEIIKPPKLKKGDVIGIVSPSSPVASFCPRRLSRGIKQLEKSGFQIKLGQYVEERVNYTAGTIDQRLSDLQAMFADSEVKAIIATIGGLNSNQLLDKIDYSLISSNPKIFVGYSDITALLNAISVKTGLVTYYGPMILPQFGEFDGIYDYTWKYFKDLLIAAEKVDYSPSEWWTDERLDWDTADDRPREKKQNPGWQVLFSGKVKGRLIGGNLSTLVNLIGTEYWPDMKGAILFLEDDEEDDPATYDRHLTHLKQTGVFDQIAGLLFGRPRTESGFSEDNSLAMMVKRLVGKKRLPTMLDLDFGHTDPIFTLPIGIKAEMNADEKTLELLETGVKE